MERDTVQQEKGSATEEWGREMLSATADYIVDFLAEFSRIPLPVPTRFI